MKNYVKLAEDVMNVLGGESKLSFALSVEEDVLYILRNDEEIASFTVREGEKHEVKFNSNFIDEKSVIEMIMLINGVFGARNYIDQRRNNRPKEVKKEVETVRESLAKKAMEEKKKTESPKASLRTGDLVIANSGETFFVLKDTRHGDILTSNHSSNTISLKDYDEDLNHKADLRYSIKAVKVVKAESCYLSSSSLNYNTAIKRVEDSRIAELQKQIEELKKNTGWR